MKTKPTAISVVKRGPVPEVIEVLENCLADAKAGKLRNVAIVGEELNGNMHYTAWGLENNLLMVGLLDRVKHRILCVMDDD